MLRFWGEWWAARRRYCRDELIRKMQLRIDNLEAEGKQLKRALEMQLEINARDRERVRAEQFQWSSQMGAGPTFRPNGFEE